MPHLAGIRARATFAKASGPGGGGSAGTIVSAANRSRVPINSQSTLPMGAQISSNAYGYLRYFERAPGRALAGLRPVFANLAVTSGFATTFGGSLPTGINGGRQEQGVGVGQQIRVSTVTGLTGTGIAQTGATTTVGTFTGARTDATFASGATTYWHLYKLDNTATPPAMIGRTYAQFTADGGSIADSTVNGATVANSQAVVPDGYVIVPDAGGSVAAGAAYFAQLEIRTPCVTVSSIAADGSGSIVVQLSAAGDIGLLRVGNLGTVANATGNTTVNGTWAITALDTGANTVTLAATGSTNATVTGTPTLRFGRPSGVINSSVTANPLGDFYKASATQQDYIGKGDWTGLSTNLLSDGTIQTGFAAILGSDATAGPAAIVYGDSIAAEVRDGQTNSPSAILQGDADGNLAFANRTFGAAGVSWFRTAVPGMKASIAAQDGSDTFRRWLGGFADTAFTEMMHNDASISGGYAGTGMTGFRNVAQDHFTRIRAALRGSAASKRLIVTTLTPSTTQVGTDKWTTGRSSTYQTFVDKFQPGGLVMGNYHPDLKGGVFTGVDGIFDLAGYASHLDGSTTAEDGYWPVDGATNYKYTTDGTHLSRDGAAGVAAQVSATAIKALLGPGF